MEGYRMCGFLRYEEGKMESAFEFFLLSLAGGSYLPENIRRNSTFTYAAYLALHTGKQVRAPSDIEILENNYRNGLAKIGGNLLIIHPCNKPRPEERRIYSVRI